MLVVSGYCAVYRHNESPHPHARLVYSPNNARFIPCMVMPSLRHIYASPGERDGYHFH